MQTISWKNAQRHIPSLCVEETKAGSILTAMSINSTSLAKADLWGGYIFGRKFSASATPWHGLNFQVCLVHKNQLGEGVMFSLESGISNSQLPDASHPSASGQKRLASLAFDPLVLLTPLVSLDISLRGLV